jgi:hypothetical protein
MIKKQSSPMTRNRSLLFLIAFFCIAIGLPAEAGSERPGKLEQAEALYDLGDHDLAYRQYLALAKDGHPLAQYRVSYMLAIGLGTREDAVESLAWAVLAKENAGEILEEYQDAVAAMVPGKSRKKAQKKADYYLRRWGDGVAAKNEGTMAKSSEGGCTGSRLAGNCGASSGGGGYWIVWNEDRSGDPLQKDVLRQINASIGPELDRLASES